MDEKELENIVKRSIQLIEQRSDKISNLLYKLELGLNEAVQAAFFDKVDVKDGRVVYNARTKQAVNSINRAANQYMAANAPQLTREIADSVKEVLDLNRDYFSGEASAKTIAQIHEAVTAGIYDQLGITSRGGLVEGGYMASVVNNPSIAARVKQVATNQSIIGAKPSMVKQAIENLIKGDTKTGATGLFAREYKETLQDVVATVDRMSTDAYADQLGLNFAIYQGNIIQTSRLFCRERAGKVFHRSEIAKFDPPTAKPPGYNPFTMLGGYNCRHRLSWITDAVALRLRPDVEKFLKAA